VLVIHEQKRSHKLALARLSKVAVIFRFFVKTRKRKFMGTFLFMDHKH